MRQREPCLRLYPEDRLVPLYDENCLRRFQTTSYDTIGWRVIDDFVEEHIQ